MDEDKVKEESCNTSSTSISSDTLFIMLVWGGPTSISGLFESSKEEEEDHVSSYSSSDSSESNGSDSSG